MAMSQIRLKKLIIGLYEKHKGDLREVQHTLETEYGIAIRYDSLRGKFYHMGLKSVTPSVRYREDILAVYKLNGGSAAKAQRQLEEKGISLSVTTIMKCWKKEGLKIAPHGGRRVSLVGLRGALNDDEIKMVMQSYKDYNGCVSCAERYGPFSIKTYKKYWRLHSLQIQPHNNHKDNLEDRL